MVRLLKIFRPHHASVLKRLTFTPELGVYTQGKIASSIAIGPLMMSRTKCGLSQRGCLTRCPTKPSTSQPPKNKNPIF